MSSQFQTALLRAAISAVLGGGLAFLTGLQQGQTVKVAAIAGGVQFIYYLIARGGIEGIIDTNAVAPVPAPAPPAVKP